MKWIVLLIALIAGDACSGGAGAASRGVQATATPAAVLIQPPATLGLGVPQFARFRLTLFSNPATAAVAGPDAAVWFTIQNDSPRIGSITATGEVRTYALPGSQSSVPLQIVVGSDGAMWFTRGDVRNMGPAVIGRLSVDGRYNEYAIPQRITDVAGLVTGPDGNLWFTERAGNKIGRITLPGVEIKEFALPSYPSVQCGQLCPGGMAVGQDGALWFTNTQLVGVPGIGRITTDGAISLYSLPAGSVPEGIRAGPDGNLWFTELRGPGLGRITTAGQVTEFSIPGFPHAGVAVSDLTSGPDGAVWFTIRWDIGETPTATVKPGQLGRITPAGTSTMYTPPGTDTSGAIVLGRDGYLWAFGDNFVTRVTLN